MTSQTQQLSFLTISSYVAGGIYFLLALFLLCVFFTKTIHNRYTRIAYIELFVALILRVGACFVFAWYARGDSAKLSSGMFD